MRTFDRYHRAVKLIYYPALAVLGMLYDRPVCLAILVSGAFAQLRLCRGRRVWLDAARLYLPVAALAILLNGLTAHYGVTKLLRLPWGNYVTLEALVAGCAIAARLAGLLMVFAVMYRSVAFEEILAGLGRFLPKTASMLALAARYVPLYARRMTETARTLRLTGAYSGLSGRFRLGTDALQAGLSRSAEGSLITADAMAARGYALAKPKRARIRLHRDEAVCAGLILPLIAGLAAGLAARIADCSYSPVFFTEPVTGAAAAIFIGYGVFVFLPVFVYCREVLLWKRSGRKT